MSASGKVAIVTGAGSGVGRAAALALLQGGYQVVLAGRRAERLQQSVAAAGSPVSRALAVPTDASDPPSVRALFLRARKAFGRLGLLPNSAGVHTASLPLQASVLFLTVMATTMPFVGRN